MKNKKRTFVVKDKKNKNKIYCKGTQTECADVLGVHVSTVSHAFCDGRLVLGRFLIEEK